MTKPNKYSNAFGNSAPPPSGKVPQDEVNKFCAAARDGRTDEVRAGIKAYGAAIVDRRDQIGDTALTWAAWMGHKDIVVLLLDSGADIDLKGMSSRTALGWAANGGRNEIVQLLLERHADARITDVDKCTPLDIAQRTHQHATAAIITTFEKERGRIAATKAEQESARAKSDAALDALKKKRPDFKLKK